MLELHRQHERRFAENRFVYPVLSRRSRGISLGVNLNPDKVCNFDCIYCQVNRREPSDVPFVEFDRLLEELEWLLSFAASGGLFTTEKFRDTPAELRVLRDIAFSGDGEPTTYGNFDHIIERCAEVKRRLGLDTVKMVLITNASMFHKPVVARGLALLDANQGEIWAKLDAGTEAYFQLIDRTTLPLARIVRNITEAARVRPLVIQSLFMRVHGEGPGEEEREAYCDRLNEITAAGGRIARVQVYTVARQPAESYVAPLPAGEVDALAALVIRRTGLPTEVFYGPGGE